MEEKEKVFEALKEAVVSGDHELAIKTAKRAIEINIDAYACIMKGLSLGMQVVSDKYEKREVFVPQILRSARAMNMAVEILKPHIEVGSTRTSGKIVLGVVAGDIHDIGKNLVKLLCESAGFEVIDLGKDVPVEKFVQTAKEEATDIVGMSALMTTSMIGMPDVIKSLKEQNVSCKVVIGGGPVSQSYADSIGADGYADDAAKAVKLVEKLLGG
ncbi:MAG: corrinoid protein [Candidatus Methanofastidiosia archaeon]